MAAPGQQGNRRRGLSGHGVGCESPGGCLPRTEWFLCFALCPLPFALGAGLFPSLSTRGYMDLTVGRGAPEMKYGNDSFTYSPHTHSSSWEPFTREMHL